MTREPAPAPPAWARIVDLVCLGLGILTAIVVVWGGVRIRLGGVRFSLTSPIRLVIWAIVIGIARHIATRSSPVYEDLPRRLGRWRRLLVPDDISGRPAAPVSAGFVVGLIALFTALTALMTFPLALHINDAVSDPGDPLLNLWVIRWIAHQLPRDPMHLFDGNIFAPERNTLAYSETLLAPSVLAAPLA